MGYTVTKMTVNKAVLILENRIKCHKQEKEEAKQMAIKALKQEPETGHWEWLTEDKYRCSNCNSETRVDECMNEPMYEFCPFCGARMKSEE